MKNLSQVVEPFSLLEIVLEEEIVRELMEFRERTRRSGEEKEEVIREK